MKLLPASSRTLSAFAIDIDHALEQMGLVSKIKIKKTGLSECALVVVCTIKESTTSQAEVAQAMERVWEEVRFSYSEDGESCKITTITGEVQLQFSTSVEGRIITGRIEILGFC